MGSSITTTTRPKTLVYVCSLLALLALFAAPIAAQAPPPFIPECAIPCTNAAVRKDGHCSETDHACVCGRQMELTTMEAFECVTNACSTDVAMSIPMDGAKYCEKLAASGGGSSQPSSSLPPAAAPPASIVSSSLLSTSMAQITPTTMSVVTSSYPTTSPSPSSYLTSSWSSSYVAVTSTMLNSTSTVVTGMRSMTSTAASTATSAVVTAGAGQASNLASGAVAGMVAVGAVAMAVGLQ